MFEWIRMPPIWRETDWGRRRRAERDPLGWQNPISLHARRDWTLS